MPTAPLSFLIIDANGTRTALCGLPLLHPTVICFTSQAAAKQANDLAIAVRDFLRGLGPQVQVCAPACKRNHDISGVPSCPECAQPESIQLAVLVGRSGRGAPTISMPDIAWWTSGSDNRRILPIFKTGDHPDQVLPVQLKKYNAAFWNDTPTELATTVLSAAGLTPESHRIFISYRRLETQPLAEDLFGTLNQLGFNVFLDRFAVPPAVNFQRRLHHDLAEKSMVLLLESDRFGESAWTTEEITYCKRYELGLYALRLPWGMAGGDGTTKKLPDVPVEWRDDLKRVDFEAEPEPVPSNGSQYLQWGRLTAAARTRIGLEVRRRHDAAILRRRQNMRTQMLAELAKRRDLAVARGEPNVPDFRERADGLLAVESKRKTAYAVWLTPRPPELPDFHATHAGCQFPPNTVGVIVGLKSLLEPEAQRRLKWLSGVCKLVLVDQGHIVSATRRIAEGTL